VRLATAEALGQLVGLISKPQLTSALPRLLPAILTVCRKEEEDPLPVTHSLHMVLSAVLIKYSAPLVDFQALIPVLHLLLPRAYFSASNGSGDELSSYLKVKTVVAIGKKLVQLEWVPIGGTRFFHLLPVPQVICTFPLFVYQVIISCKLRSFFYILLILLLQSYNEVLHCFVTIGIVYPEDTFTYLLHVMEPFFLLLHACITYLNHKPR
jgi:hypothetical protein